MLLKWALGDGANGRWLNHNCDNRCLGTSLSQQPHVLPLLVTESFETSAKIIFFIVMPLTIWLTHLFNFGRHGGCWWFGTFLHNADIGWSVNAGSSQDNVNEYDTESYEFPVISAITGSIFSYFYLHKHKFNIHFDVILSKSIWSHNFDLFVQCPSSTHLHQKF